MSDERLEWHLQNWARWYYAPAIRLGYPRRTSGLISGASNDFDDLADAAANRLAVSCNAIIGDLVPAQFCALSCEYLHAVWRFPRDNKAKSLSLAKNRIKEGLERRGIP